MASVGCDDAVEAVREVVLLFHLSVDYLPSFLIIRRIGKKVFLLTGLILNEYASGGGCHRVNQV